MWRESRDYRFIRDGDRYLNNAEYIETRNDLQISK